jgi:PhnB protein
MSAPNVYLFFNNNCAEAMRFYEKVLGGKLDMMTAGEAPEGAGPKSPVHAGMILHARLALDGQAIMASDWLSPEPYEPMKGFAVSLAFPTVEEGKRVFDALAEGGKVSMSYSKTFWVEAFGMVHDRFGTPWMVNGGKPSL